MKIRYERNQVKLDTLQNKQLEIVTSRQDEEAEYRRQQREIELENQREDAKAKREERRMKLEAKLKKQGVNEGVNKTVKKMAPTSGDLQSRMLKILQSFDTPDDINKSQLARELGVSRPTVNKHMKELEKSGRLVLNGKVEVQ